MKLGSCTVFVDFAVLVDCPIDIVIFNPSRKALGTVIDMTMQMVSFGISVGPKNIRNILSFVIGDAWKQEMMKGNSLPALRKTKKALIKWEVKNPVKTLWTLLKGKLAMRTQLI